MTDSKVVPFLKPPALWNCQVDVDRAIARADLVAEVRRRRVLVAELQRVQAADLADAEMRLAMAYLALDEFDHEGRAVR